MKSFQWDKNYITGLSDVDRQHKKLVDIINLFGNLIAKDNAVFNKIEEIFKELADYAQYHFQTEEALMSRFGIDQRHFDHHIESHQFFLKEVTSMHSSISQGNSKSKRYLLDFLINWLAYHILGEDQNMARQIKSIKSGLDPGTAYENEEKEREGALEALLIALSRLFDQVSFRNRELMEFNLTLEEKVAQRTKELHEANRHLEEISLTDPLTGLPNRRHAMRALATLWIESIKKDLPLTCMMLDVDYFKEVNDTYGHDAGDLVLSELAKLFQHSVRNDDIVCRLGGDEFLIICPNTDKDGGKHIAELILRAISRLRISIGGESYHGSISVGVASRTRNMMNYQELIKAADKAVYIAKQDGKNCVRT